MDIDKLTIAEAKQIAAMVSGLTSAPAATPVPAIGSPWEIGANYLIRTVTMYDVGRLVGVTDQELVLEDASWVADTGRFGEALKTLKFNELEPFPSGRVIIGRGGIIDAVKIDALPAQKDAKK